MYPFMLYLPTRLIVGSGTINRIGMIATDTDKKKALIHYGSERMLKSGLIDRIVDLLSTAGMECVLLGGVVPNPRLSLVRQGIEICRKENVDLVLAVGGGSVIDSAKAISCGAMYDGDVWDFYSKGQKPPVGIRLGCILTIAAAGSEMSNTSVLTNEDGWIKMVCSHDHFRPTFAVLDPDLTLSVPKYQTACGCADIFLHTAERYLGGGQSSEVTDSMSEALLRTVVKNAEVLMKDPENKNARAEIMYAGTLSQNGLTGCGGNGGDWATHRLEHELGGLFDVTHGAGLTAVWGSWARFAVKAAPERFAELGEKVFGMSRSGNLAEDAESAIQRVEAYFKMLELPLSIPELGIEVTEADLELMADKCAAGCGGKLGKMRVLTRDDMLYVYQAAMNAGK